MEKDVINVLIIEDNPADLKLVSEMLNDSKFMSFRVKYSDYLEKALKMLESEKFDVVLSDLSLPDSQELSGFEKIIGKHPTVPVIVLTGIDDENIGLQVVKKNSGDYLVKGKTNSDMLIRSIRYAIERKRRDTELQKLNRTLKALSDSGKAMLHAADENEYLESVCGIVVKDCGYAMVWIGYAENDENKTVRPVAQAGFEEGYLKTVNITWADSERGRGPTGTAIRTGKVTMTSNMLTDPDFKPWRDEAIKRGYASSIVLPLTSGGKTFGAITIYSKEADPVSKDETELLTELANDLAYGITTIRLNIANKQAEKILKNENIRLQELDRMKSEFVSIVSHDLRTPLTSIMGFADTIMRKKLKLTEKQKATFIGYIREESRRLSRLISDYLDLSKIESGKFELNLKNVNIRKVINSTVEMFLANTKKTKLKWEFGPGLPEIKLDKDRITQVLQNLIDNAIKYSPISSTIDIIVKKELNNIIVSVNDEGQGVPDEEKNKVFDRYYRLKNEVTRKEQGTGLGLTISKAIVERHGGKIWVENNSPVGSRFIFTVPLKDK